MRGETRQERAGINDLLRHPCAGFSNFTLNQHSRHARGSGRCRIRLSATEKSRMLRMPASPNIDAERKPRAFVRGAILAPSCEGMTDPLVRQQM